MTSIQLADRLCDALVRAGLVSGAAGQENRLRRVLTEELEAVEREKAKAFDAFVAQELADG